MDPGILGQQLQRRKSITGQVFSVLLVVYWLASCQICISSIVELPTIYIEMDFVLEFRSRLENTTTEETTGLVECFCVAC